MKIKDIIKKKGPMVYSIDPDKTVQDCVESLVRHNVGALLVIEDGDPVGIITERDIVRLCKTSSKGLDGILVRDVMTRDLIIGNMDDEVDALMSVMTERRFRHMPILQNGKLAGLISIGDVVKSSLKDQQVEIKYLRDYIVGKNIAVEE